MGVRSIFSSSSADEPGVDASYAEWMAYGKRELHARRTKPAAKAFGHATVAAPNDPLPLAYRSWAERLEDKARAIADAEEATRMGLRCSEAYMSLALAHATGPTDFEQAGMAFAAGRHFPPKDTDGSVLFIGVFLMFIDVFASMREDDEGLIYDFKPTPLRNAADWLLSGQHVAALAAFQKIYESGRELPGALGLAATHWTMGDKDAARHLTQIALPRVPEKESGLRVSLYNFLNA